MSARSYVVGLGGRFAKPGERLVLRTSLPRAMIVQYVVITAGAPFNVLELRAKPCYDRIFRIGAPDPIGLHPVIPDGLRLEAGAQVELHLECTRPMTFMRWLCRKRDPAAAVLVGTVAE